MGVLRILGIVICVISGAAIWKAMGTLGRANDRLRAAGSSEPIPMTPAMRTYVVAIHIAFVAGLALAVLGG